MNEWLPCTVHECIVRLVFDISIITSYRAMIVSGIIATIGICATSCVAGLGVGILVALARLSRRGWLRAPAAGFVEVMRDTPFLVQVFLIFYALPASGIILPPLTAGILALSLYGGAYFAESVRGAILSVPRGQMDSARAMGMSYPLAMRRVIFPQMMGYLIPPLTNQIIGLIKDSSVLSIITVSELTMVATFIGGQTFSVVEVLTLVTVIYWLITAGLATGMGFLERRAVAYLGTPGPMGGPVAASRRFWG